MQEAHMQQKKIRKIRSKLPTDEPMRGGRDKQQDTETRRAGDGGKQQNAGGPEHRGIEAGEDRNP